jgi:hypothetical protein
VPAPPLLVAVHHDQAAAVAHELLVALPLIVLDEVTEQHRDRSTEQSTLGRPDCCRGQRAEHDERAGTRDEQQSGPHQEPEYSSDPCPGRSGLDPRCSRS